MNVYLFVCVLLSPVLLLRVGCEINCFNSLSLPLFLLCYAKLNRAELLSLNVQQPAELYDINKVCIVQIILVFAPDNNPIRSLGISNFQED